MYNLFSRWNDGLFTQPHVNTKHFVNAAPIHIMKVDGDQFTPSLTKQKCKSGQFISIAKQLYRKFCISLSKSN